MPAPSPTGQPDAERDWFHTPAGEALLDSERAVVEAFLKEGRGLAWLWIGRRPDPLIKAAQGRGLHLHGDDGPWQGDLRCHVPLPLANESIGTVVCQHVGGDASACRELLAECARILVPGGRLALFALNPLSPYRWRWRGMGLRASEPLVWRRRLREAGLTPEPVSQGIGPGWREVATPGLQQGAGLRAGYLLRAEKRSLPLTPVRTRRRLAVPQGVPAT